MDWVEIRDAEDAKYLLDCFGGFHDGCLKELKYISGEYVAETLSMQAVNALRSLSVIFQRQCAALRAIEIVFDGLVRMNLAPSDPRRYDGVIYDAYLNIVDGLVYWAETPDFDVSKIDSDPEYKQITWIIAEKAKWRTADEYSGDEAVYINRL